MLSDFVLVKQFGEREHGGGFADVGIPIDRDGAFSLVAVLNVAVEDVLEVFVKRGELRRFEWSNVGMPHTPSPVVNGACPLAKTTNLADCQRLRAFATVGVDEVTPPSFAG